MILDSNWFHATNQMIMLQAHISAIAAKLLKLRQRMQSSMMTEYYWQHCVKSATIHFGGQSRSLPCAVFFVQTTFRTRSWLVAVATKNRNSKLKMVCFLSTGIYSHFYLTCACAAKGKAIGLSACLLSVDTKIATSRDLGVWATRKRKKSVEMVVNFTSLCFESFGKATAFCWPRLSTAPPCAFAHAHNLISMKVKVSTNILLQLSSLDLCR
jgi:hypothetical protein